MFSHIFENSADNFFLPARMVMQDVTPEFAHYDLRQGNEKPKAEDESIPPKKPEADSNKPKEGAGEKPEEKTKEDLKKLKEGISKGLFENKEEHDKMKEAIERLTPQQLREYYDAHEPETYNGRLWTAWNMDFVKNVMLIKDATPLIARKYAWVFQEWLKDKGFNPGVDGRIGKKTTEALGRYLCSIGGNDDICKKIGGKTGEGKETYKGGLEFSMENLNQFYNIYIQALRKENPTLDIGRGYIVNKDVFKGIFEDIVNGGPTFDPHDIEGWKAHFADLLYSGLSNEQEIFQIYPYSLVENLDTEYEQKNKQAEEADSVSSADIPKEWESITYDRKKLDLDVQALCDNIKGRYDYYYNSAIKDLKNEKESADVFEKSSRQVLEAYNKYTNLHDEYLKLREENDKVQSRPSSTPTDKETASANLDKAKRARWNAILNIEKTIQKEVKQKQDKLVAWLKDYDVDKFTFLSNQVSDSAPIGTYAGMNIFDILKDSSRTRIFNNFAELVRGCKNKEFIAFQDRASNLGQEMLLDTFNRFIIEKNENNLRRFTSDNDLLIA